MLASVMGDEVSWGNKCESVLLSFFWVSDTLEKLMNAILLPLKVFAYTFKEFTDPPEAYPELIKLIDDTFKKQNNKTGIERKMGPGLSPGEQYHLEDKGSTHNGLRSKKKRRKNFKRELSKLREKVFKNGS